MIFMDTVSVIPLFKIDDVYADMLKNGLSSRILIKTCGKQLKSNLNDVIRDRR